MVEDEGLEAASETKESAGTRSEVRWRMVNHPSTEGIAVKSIDR